MRFEFGQNFIDKIFTFLCLLILCEQWMGHSAMAEAPLVQIGMLLPGSDATGHRRDANIVNYLQREILAGRGQSGSGDKLPLSLGFAQRNVKLLVERLDQGLVEPQIALTRACSLLQRGVVALAAPPDMLQLDPITDYATALNVPLVSFQPSPAAVMATHSTDHKQPFIINLNPPIRLIGQAAAALVAHFGWRSFVVLYEHDEDLVQLQDLLTMSSHSFGSAPDVKTLQMPVQLGRYPKFMKFVKNTMEHFKMVVHLRADRIDRFLEVARGMQMTAARYSYIFTTLDLHTLRLDIDPKLFKCNLTGVRLVDPQFAARHGVAQRWHDFALLDQLTRNISLPNSLVTEAAIAVDTLLLISEAAQKALVCAAGGAFGAAPCRYRANYAPAQLVCTANQSWANGRNWMKVFSETTLSGSTGQIELSSSGERTNIHLAVLQFDPNVNAKGVSRFSQVGMWSHADGYTSHEQVLTEIAADLRNRTLRIVVMLEEPFVMLLPNKSPESDGNAAFVGYSVDLIRYIAAECGFNYTLHEVADQIYGQHMVNGEWNGMIGELQRGEADLAVAATTISSSRSEVIDFTVPFMHLGISILYRKPASVQSQLFAFLQPLSPGVWVYLCLSYMTVSLMMWLLARFSPYEWYNPHPHCPSDTADSQFTVLNSLWFSVGSLMQQGSDVAPRALSTRMVAAVWWFFTVVLISSYTAKLAAFLTVARMHTDIESAEDLAKQEKESKIPTYERMWQFMESTGKSAFVNTSKEGIARVKAGNYAYLMESTMLEYYAERDCELMQIGGLIDSKGYGIGLPKGSPFRQPISQAILKLQEKTTLETLKNKWWSRSKCKAYKIETGKQSARKLKNIGGIFFILFGGLAAAFLIALAEFFYKKRHDPELAKVSLCSALLRECRRTAHCASSGTGQTTPRRRLRRLSALMAVPLYEPRAGHPVKHRVAARTLQADLGTSVGSVADPCNSPSAAVFRGNVYRDGGSHSMSQPVIINCDREKEHMLASAGGAHAHGSNEHDQPLLRGSAAPAHCSQLDQHHWPPPPPAQGCSDSDSPTEANYFLRSGAGGAPQHRTNGRVPHQHVHMRHPAGTVHYLHHNVHDVLDDAHFDGAHVRHVGEGRAERRV